MEKIKLQLIRIGHAEGISYLLLLFIAMPLKYMAGLPLAVRIAGSIHGILFIAFIVVLAEAYKKLNLSISKTAILFLLSIIPFGTFFIKKQLHQK